MPRHSEDLSAGSCVPCRGGVPALSAEEVAYYSGFVPAWTVCDDGRRIERRFRFKTFAEAFDFVTAIAALAARENHHPDISFGWGYALVSLQTHVIKGLHRNDFVLAAKIDLLPGIG